MLSKNVFLARAYLQKYVSKPWMDKPLQDYIKLMNKITLKERRKIQNDTQVKKLIKRVNR